MFSVAGAPVHPKYSPVTVTSSLVYVGPGPVHVSLGPECVDTAPVSGEYSSNLREIFNVSVYRRKAASANFFSGHISKYPYISVVLGYISFFTI